VILRHRNVPFHKRETSALASPIIVSFSGSSLSNKSLV
jgi:hypothetical protein